MMLEPNLLTLKRRFACDAHWITVLERERTEYVR
jgi:hypothetical protein